jgi:2,4'-dihydroxyacetophenone dioxygenase
MTTDLTSETTENRAVTNPKVTLVEQPKSYEMPNDALFVPVDDIPWTPIPGWPGSYTKLLSFDIQSGRTTTLFKMDPGARLPVHKHFSSVDIYVVKGTFGYGDQYVTAPGFVYEPTGVVHEPIAAEGEIILFAVAYGPTQTFWEDGRPGPVGDVGGRVDLVVANGAAAHLGL